MRILFPAIFLAFFVCGDAIAQTAGATGSTRLPVRMGKVKFRTVETPQYAVKVDGSGGQQRARNEWLEAVAEFDTAPEWTDELTFVFHILLKGKAKDLPEGSKEFNNFTGDVTYINIPKDNGHRASIYLEPRILSRYGDPVGCAVEVKYKGQVVKTEVATGSPSSKWWGSTAGGKAGQILGLLKNKSQTPFVFVDYDDHPLIKSFGVGQ